MGELAGVVEWSDARFRASGAIDKPKFFAKVVSKGRARIVQMMGKIKRFKRFAHRCEETAVPRTRPRLPLDQIRSLGLERRRVV